MKVREQELKKYIREFKLEEKIKLLDFIETNPVKLTVEALSRIAELVNNSRVDTAAYYTDSETLSLLATYLPVINKNEIRILEPSVGVGNFLKIIIEKYSHVKKLIIDVNDIDRDSIQITKLLNRYRNIPENVEINYRISDFLAEEYSENYDIVIGNPPFLKINKNNFLPKAFNDNITKNMSGFFIQKALKISNYVVMIMPKYFLNNPDFKNTRDRVNEVSIPFIIDFGEKGFKGVLIETIALVLSNVDPIDFTTTYSLTKNITNVVKQSTLTSTEYPYWLLYRNNFFDEIAKDMKFGVFKVFRDRQLTTSNTNFSEGVRVLKSRNIKRDGTGITSIPEYDSYLLDEHLNKYVVSKYLHRDDVYLSPNMTYYPRVIKKPKNVLVNGSVAILENKDNLTITNKHLEFLSSNQFEEFYRIARNYSTRSLNIDSNSVYFFGLYK